MFAFIFIMVLMFFTLWLEVMLGAYGFWIPLCSYLVFYVSVTWSRQTGIAVALTLGACMDMLYFRENMYSATLLLIVVPAAVVWLVKADDKAWWMRVVFGVFLGAAWVVPQALYNSFHLGWTPGHDLLLRNAMTSVFVIIFSGALLPVYIAWVDSMSERMGIARFDKAREQIIHGR